MIKESHSDIGPALSVEMPAEHRGVKASCKTPRKWLQQDDIRLSRKRSRTFPQARLRRECHDELIQIYGSGHRRFRDRCGPCTLLVFMNDVTSRLMELRFVALDIPFSSFEALENYPQKNDRLVAIYSDKHTVFRFSKTDEHMTGMTQFE